MLGACASIPKGQYGLTEVDWKGTEDMSSQALEPCLALREREAFELRLGLGSPSCGAPPFDTEVPSLSLWTWPWVDWPVYDPAIFEVDRARILRWYQARGYFHTRVVGVRHLDDDDEEVVEPERCTGDDCELTVVIEIEEGKPTLVSAIAVAGVRDLEPELRALLYRTVTMHPGDRFDESTYASDKDALLEVLREHSYANATVVGKVEIDRVALTARVRYEVTSGPACVFGKVRIEGNGDISGPAVIDVADFQEGDPYQQSLLSEGERAVYALREFSTVRIEPEPVANSNVVNLVIRVTAGRTERWRLGVGIMSGTMQLGTSSEVVSVPEWDVHLRVGYRNEDFLGGMRKLSIEERPRLILLDAFPGVPSDGPKLGNVLTINFEQPRAFEKRTVFFFDGQWDVGPDAFLGFFRHDVSTKIGVRRPFWHQWLTVELALQHDLYEIFSDADLSKVSSYRLPFIEQQVKFDIRDDVQRPSRGIYLATTFQEALQLGGYGSWDYLRWLPEARAYQRLPWRIVLAQRLAFGALFIYASDRALDPVSTNLGPQKYRLRGGGANSNRGFGAGELGDGIDGGKRRWEGSFEVRLPLAEDLGFTLFFDAGDVNAGSAIRFTHLNASTGFGIRYFTPFAPIRFDAGWRIPGLQVVGGGAEPQVETGVLPNAAHLTIGEAF